MLMSVTSIVLIITAQLAWPMLVVVYIVHSMKIFMVDYAMLSIAITTRHMEHLHVKSIRITGGGTLQRVRSRH